VGNPLPPNWGSHREPELISSGGFAKPVPDFLETVAVVFRPAANSVLNPMYMTRSFVKFVESLVSMVV